ncbi:SDR family oxidoreductase [Pseudomonas veronii]|uniref:SDR family oxidoreductase n=3 Tax=Pseudomonas veronii TaxID=76761 RepID=A0A4P7YAZ9_PSEVE|nr:SDR family oxidoreductase [Pseudomonas veronii]QCG68185.2 SDR family oxidoreductase [Pseudomonas veronii]
MGREKGKVALVTGARTGPGETGSTPSGAGRREGSLLISIATMFALSSMASTRSIWVRHSPSSTMLSSKDEWAKVVEVGVKAFGSITVLVNSAGVLSPALYDEVTHGHRQTTIDVNEWSQFVGMQTTVPYMKEAGVGSIVNIASLAVADAGGRFSFSRAAAIELAGSNICVNSVDLGVIPTAMVDEVFPNKVAYLTSDEADFTTGTSQIIEGGLSYMGVFRRTDR